MNFFFHFYEIKFVGANIFGLGFEIDLQSSTED